jgi:hypothetical protein
MRSENAALRVENERLRREWARITEQRDILQKLRASFPKPRTGVFPSLCDEAGTSVPDDVRGYGRLAQRALSMTKHVDLGEGHFTPTLRLHSQALARHPKLGGGLVERLSSIRHMGAYLALEPLGVGRSCPWHAVGFPFGSS